MWLNTRLSSKLQKYDLPPFIFIPKTGEESLKGTFRCVETVGNQHPTSVIWSYQVWVVTYLNENRCERICAPPQMYPPIELSQDNLAPLLMYRGVHTVYPNNKINLPHKKIPGGTYHWNLGYLYRGVYLSYDICKVLHKLL